MFFKNINQTPGEVSSIRMPCDYITDPAQIFGSICNSQTHSLLLESAEIDSKDNVKSIMLISTAVTFECYGKLVVCTAKTANGHSVISYLEQVLKHTGASLQLNENELKVTFPDVKADVDEEQRLQQVNAFEVLRRVINDFKQSDNEPYSIFLGGAFSYDMYANFENLQPVTQGFNDCPDFCFYLAETLMVIDHQNKKSDLIGNIFSGENVYANCFEVGRQIEDIKQAVGNIRQSADSSLENVELSREEIFSKTTIDTSDKEFIDNVIKLKENILEGDIFQVVPSRGFTLPCDHPLTAYRYLKQENPSPYMFYMKHQHFTLFGASPESSLKYDAKQRQVEVYPIAGTRIRGFKSDGSINPDLDSRIELELRSDQKEVSEHTMLVDLARNDIARISETGTRYVKDLLNVDRYSYVMHLVSRVVGTLRSEFDALHAYQACMNMGTLVGAPKLSAASLIRSVEQKTRGSYGGAVGYINGAGDMDTCIVIRSAFVKDNKALIQAGAGVVHDSVPEMEAQETTNKAMAVLRAVAKAERRNHG